MGPTKRIMKEFGIREYSFNNKVRFIKVKLRHSLRQNGLLSMKGHSFEDLVMYFREFTDEKPYRLTKYECYKWLFTIWHDSSNEFIRKTDPLNFYISKEWRDLRAKFLRDFYPRCMNCGSCERISVDHIKPRSLYPELELDYENLQVLCTPCNSRKSNRDIIDYRSLQPF
jgi:5-methylcytosine-specific restriction endonuclease McrA